jgi:hypothetical protein
MRSVSLRPNDRGGTQQRFKSSGDARTLRPSWVTRAPDALAAVLVICAQRLVPRKNLALSILFVSLGVRTDNVFVLLAVWRGLLGKRDCHDWLRERSFRL